MAIVGAVVCGVAVTWAAASFGLRLVYSGSHCGGGGVKATRGRVKETAFATTLYYIDHGLRCPARDELVAGEYVTHNDLVDAWGMSITYHCTPDGDVVVRSAGPDRRFHTCDDITNH